MPSNNWRRPLSIALSVQVATSAIDMAVPVLGPAITSSIGVPASYVGYYSSAAAGGAIFFYLLGGGLVRRAGPERILQIGALVCAGSLLLALSGAWWLVIAAGLLIGLGFGANAPASGLLLQRSVPRQRLRLAFSIKQAGVPLGALIAGAGLPVLAGIGTWQTALLAASALGVTVAVFVELSMRRDRGSFGRVRSATGGSGLADLKVLLGLIRLRSFRRLVAVGALLAVVQGSLNAFLVTYLVTELQLSLVFAGGLYAAFQAASIPGRILSGWLGDKQALRPVILMHIGVASSAAVAILSVLNPGVLPLTIAIPVAAAGFVVGSWNGVLLAESAEAAPEGRVAEAQNAVALGIFAGFLLGPLVFATVVAVAGFQATFLVLAGIALLSALAARARSL
ncbi:MFS transporter [Algihabitans albus]|uniref:MFS transporter n=1 Tax=Algihabitans albus TaxID=2164067 RepID=UPI000E5D8DEE|nr:MFS transporter [Algihabitans albus]